MTVQLVPLVTVIWLEVNHCSVCICVFAYMYLCICVFVFVYFVLCVFGYSSCPRCWWFYWRWRTTALWMCMYAFRICVFVCLYLYICFFCILGIWVQLLPLITVIWLEVNHCTVYVYVFVYLCVFICVFVCFLYICLFVFVYLGTNRTPGDGDLIGGNHCTVCVYVYLMYL